MTKLAKQRDPDAAAGKGIEAIHLAGHLSSTRSADRIRVLSRQLTIRPTVRDFQKRARVFTRSTDVKTPRCYYWASQLAIRYSDPASDPASGGPPSLPFRKPEPPLTHSSG